MKRIFFYLLVILSLFLSINAKFNIGIGVVISFILIFLLNLKNTKLNDLTDIAITSSKKSLLVLRIFFLVGGITASWMASGTIPLLVINGIEIIRPNLFYILAFVVPSIISLLLGSSFGTVGTIGLILITIAKAIGADLDIAIGAIIAGSFFGDRISPLSSSGNLVATLTESDLYENIKLMFYSTIIPFTLSVILYFLMPTISSTGNVNISIVSEIYKEFSINYYLYIPILLIVIGSLLKLDVKISMLSSILSSVILALFFQKYSIIEIFEFLIFGFKLPSTSPISSILGGGGIMSMYKAIIVVFISCSLSGIIERLEIFKFIQEKLRKLQSRSAIFFLTLISSFVTGGIGCNQSIATVLTAGLMKNIYKEKNISNSSFAHDIENSAIVVSPLIPWNIASMIPATLLGATTLGYLKFTFFLYLLPLIYLLSLLIKDLKKSK